MHAEVATLINTHAARTPAILNLAKAIADIPETTVTGTIDARPEADGAVYATCLGVAVEVQVNRRGRVVALSHEAGPVITTKDYKGNPYTYRATKSYPMVPSLSVADAIVAVAQLAKREGV